MIKCVLPVLACVLLSQLVHAQILFTYGNKEATKQEFLDAFNKNYTPEADRPKALNEYLRLFINYKLKVQAAYDEKLDEQPSFREESENFKKQVAENFINEEADIKALVKEAYDRSKKDIKVSQVFIEFGNDTAEAYKKIQEAYRQLKAGKNFTETTLAFSTDEATRNNKGNLGYITVFSFPYAFENEIYKLTPGSFTTPLKGKYGYHIFKNEQERPAFGKRKIAQLLLSFPPNPTETDKKKLAVLADTIYHQIKAGTPFEKLVTKYSTDISTVNNGGLLPDVGIGQYSSDFEDKIFALQKPDDISRPFTTSYGYHIIKLVGIVPSAKTAAEAIAGGPIRQQVESSDRIEYARKTLVDKWLPIIKFQKGNYDENALWAFTDSALQRSDFPFQTITASTVVFSFGAKQILVADWIKYAKLARRSASGSPTRLYAEILKDFIHLTAGQYYREHLDEYNGAMRQQLKEFNEANLLFAGMDKHVWTKSNEDSTGLKEYYNQHKATYQWKPGVSAIAVSATSKDLANDVANRIRNKPSDWKNITGSYGNSVSADSGRYEEGQLPVQQKIENRKGFISSPEKPVNSGSWVFLYVTGVFPAAGQRSFDDSRGLITNDYQAVLENEWLDTLKKKYPIKVNEDVWKTVK